jgi:hypothetical protein
MAGQSKERFVIASADAGFGAIRAAARQRARLVATALLSSVTLLTLAAPSASASVEHPQLFTINSASSGLVHPEAIAVDSSDGDFYASSAGVVSKFDSTGNLLLTFASPPGGDSSFGSNIAVDSSTGIVYVTGAALYEYNSFGTYLSTLPVPPNVSGGPGGQALLGLSVSEGGLAVNTATHDLYVGYPGEVIDQLDSSGTLLSVLATPPEAYGGVSGIAVDSGTGDVYVGGFSSGNVFKFDSAGVFISALPPGNAVFDLAVEDSTHDVYSTRVNAGGVIQSDDEGNPIVGIPIPVSQSPSFVAVDQATGHLYVAEFAESGTGLIRVFGPLAHVPDSTTGAFSALLPTKVTVEGHVDPDSGGEITECMFEYVTDAAFQASGYASATSIPCSAATPFAGPADVSAELTGLQSDVVYHYRLVAANANGRGNPGEDQVVETPFAIADLHTGPATEVESTKAILTGSYTGDGTETHYYFQYGTDTTYGHVTATPPGPSDGAGTGTQEVSISLSSLDEGTTYHYRIVAENELGVNFGEDQSFTTDQPPLIESFSSSGLSATSAELHARINPEGFATTYRFEYGTTSSYGQSAPVPGAEIAEELSSSHAVIIHLEDLIEGAIYHFRLLAANKWGTAASVDQTFNFYPAACPNAANRQQVNASRLPDCRAYELVSPLDAGGTFLSPEGPNTGYATSPSRLAFSGRQGVIPGSGSPTNANSSLYVATRTTTGWSTRYIGLPADQASCVGGPPVSWRVSQSEVLTTPAMDRFLDWDHGPAGICNSREIGGDGNLNDPPSNSPYLWSSEGQLLGHFPSNFGSLSGTAAALACPANTVNGNQADPLTNPLCTSVSAASVDLSHIVFSSQNFALAPGGLTAAPGSAFDDDVATGAVSLISETESGTPIPGGPSDVIRFPGLSADGSHILMAAGPVPRCGYNGCPAWGPPPLGPAQLYMRVDDDRTYNIAPGHAVTYVGITSDGAKVYFTSDEQLTTEDHDTSTDLYMWSEAGQKDGEPLTLISKGDNPGAGGKPGNTDSCTPASFQKPKIDESGSVDGYEEVPWTTTCGVIPAAGTTLTDNFIASASGDLYFYSPEQLDGDRGVNGQQNLYDYRAGHVQYVTTLHPAEGPLLGAQRPSSEGALSRVQVSPDGAHAAFVTTSRITSYENAGLPEMYTFEPGTGRLLCASCLPSGEPPTFGAVGSADGLFMTNDGRAFFTSYDPLVPQDTNRSPDAYEFVDGRPQLISTGGGSGAEFDGVSADGTDAYFATNDTLIPGDRNGGQKKFYDARTDGGFPALPLAVPCAAADECHGPGSSEPPPLTPGTAALLGPGGNLKPTKKHRPKRHHKKHRKQSKARRSDERASHAHGGKK